MISEAIMLRFSMDNLEIPTSKSNLISCILCQYTAVFFMEKDNYQHYRCENKECKFIFVYPPPVDLDQVYNRDISRLNQIKMHDDSKIKLTRNIKYIKKLVKQEKVQKLLDVGSSEGKLLLALQNFNMVAMGVEANISAANNCRKLGLQVEDGFFTKEKFAGQKFQLINFADVIEHVAEPKLMLQDALSILELDGLIVIRTPNLDSLWSKLTLIISNISSIPWSSLTPPKHLSNFSHKNLKDFLRLDELRLENTFFEPPTLFYELGQLHLLRDFRQTKSFRNLGRLFLGYAWYTFTFILLKAISPITHKNFSQTVTVRKVI